MNHVVSPQPIDPGLSVRSLARCMVLPAYAQAGELRDQKFPRMGGAQQRVPYYQPARQAIKEFIASGANICVLDRAVAALEESLVVASADEATAPQALAKLSNNLRVLRDAAGFGRLREATGVLSVGSRKLKAGGVEVRSTPDLLVQLDGGPRYVFLDLQKRDLQGAGQGSEDQHRRTLELAHWLEQETGDPEATLSAYEYWVLAENRVLSWKTPRKKTVARVVEALPVIAATWLTIEPPKGRPRPGTVAGLQTGDGDGVTATR